MVKIRLQRRGRKKLPVFKIVAADSRFPRDGRFIEALGHYEPFRSPAFVSVDEERIQYWLGVGAQPTDTVRSILSSQGVMLRIHLQRKGKSPEEIATEMAAWRQAKEQREAGKASKKERRAQKKAAAAAAPESAPAA
ncbi:MAG: 30S ribosomal protein S16 [Ignavibacteriae bacterium]|nr:30S ribosomal protein S16 [Ignavibacteriota bacterium]